LSLRELNPAADDYSLHTPIFAFAHIGHRADPTLRQTPVKQKKNKTSLPSRGANSRHHVPLPFVIPVISMRLKHCPRCHVNRRWLPLPRGRLGEVTVLSAEPNPSPEVASVDAIRLSHRGEVASNKRHSHNPSGNPLVPPDKSRPLLQRLLQLFSTRNVVWIVFPPSYQRFCSAGCLPHLNRRRRP